MTTAWQNLDDVALREVFKSADAATLHKCRQVCYSWNQEILRLNKSIRKFQPDSIMMEVEGNCFRVYLGTPKSPKPFEDPSVSSSVVRRVLRHVAPPQTLAMLFKEDVDKDTIGSVVDGMSSDWCLEIQQLELVTYPASNLFKILGTLDKFSHLVTLSLSHYCNQQISCADIFKKLPELRNLRIFAFNGNSDTGVPSGLIFDEAAVEALLANQNGGRKLQRVELYNTDISVTMDVMISALQTLARLPMHSGILEKPLLLEDQKEVSTVHLLFDNCLWYTIKELDLLAEVIRISSEINFPIRQDEEVLKGDFRFHIFDTQFVLKFQAC